MPLMVTVRLNLQTFGFGPMHEVAARQPAEAGAHVMGR